MKISFLKWFKRPPSVEFQVAVTSLTFHAMEVTRQTDDAYFLSNGSVSIGIQSSTPMSIGDTVDVSLTELGFCAEVTT